MAPPAPPEPPRLAGVRRSRVRARGVDFHVTEAGPEDGLPVLALHGWPQHHWEWRDLLGDPPEGLRIIAPDLPGYGWSGPPPHRWQKEEVAQDVLALLDALGVERAILLAHDWGAYVGYRLVLGAPERFSAYLCLNMAHPWVGPRQLLPHLWRSLTYMPFIAFAGIPIQRRTDLVFWALRFQHVPRRTGVSDADLRWFSDRFRDPIAAAAGRDTYRTFLTEEAPRLSRHPEERRLSVPTRVVFGADDFAVHPDLADPATANADDYSVELVPDTGHFIADEQPGLIRERLIALARQFPPR